MPGLKRRFSNVLDRRARTQDVISYDTKFSINLLQSIFPFTSNALTKISSSLSSSPSLLPSTFASDAIYGPVLECNL